MGTALVELGEFPHFLQLLSALVERGLGDRAVGLAASAIEDRQRDRGADATSRGD